MTFFIHRETEKIFVDSHKTYSGPGGGIAKENLMNFKLKSLTRVELIFSQNQSYKL